MKLFLGVVLITALIVIAYYIFRTCKEKHSLAKVVRRILVIGWIIVFINTITLIWEIYDVVLVGYCVYFAVSDWLLYYMLRFSIEYIGGDFENYVKKRLMVLVLIADNISLSLNCVFGHLFRVIPVTMFGDELYHEMRPLPAFYTHYAIVMLLAVFCLISLFYGTVKAPAFYRNKYMLIAIIMLILVVMNVLFAQSALDLSIIGYVVAGIVIYYCAFVYTPQKLLPETLFQVAQDMVVALFLLDIDGKKLYSNRCAEKLLDEQFPLLDAEGKTLEQWCRDKYMNYAEVFTEDKVFYRGEEEKVLRIQLQRVVDSHQHLQGGYFTIQDRTEEIRQMEEERYLTTHDGLTGLYNKQYFYEKARKYMNRHLYTELIMICTDVKDFKMINDFFGTQAGDIVLKNIASMIKENAGKDAVYGRMGNDNFGILMPKAFYKENMFDWVDQETYFAGMDQAVSFPVVNYFGVYTIIDRTLPVSVMCDRARMAINKTKGGYQKRVAYYDDELRASILREKELLGDFQNAIEENQLQMYLQPQMSVDGKMLGAEALVRWVHPEKNMIMPGDFIPVFEKNGLISEVDKYIWESACRQLRKWKDQGREDVYISVNISPKDFYYMDIYQIFTDMVRKYDIAPGNIKLEITESAIVMDFKRQVELIARLQQAGFEVEMDDFGSGYSSLNMLKDLHVDVLKIDMAFLERAKDEERSKKILEMIINLSKQLGMPVIMEGVETENQVKFLSEIGCDMFQGYYFARPMQIAQFEEMYMA